MRLLNRERARGTHKQKPEDAPESRQQGTKRKAVRGRAKELLLIPGLQPRTVDATEPRTVEISVPLATGEHIV